MTTNRSTLLDKISNISKENFSALALEVFRYQAIHNPIYKRFVELLHIQPQNVQELKDIPFLPIQFFKTHAIQTGELQPEVIFTSSGTTGQTPSRHFVPDLSWYEKVSQIGFEQFYGNVEDYCFMALLPAYLERTGSSLIQMVDVFIKKSKYTESGFFLYDHATLIERLQTLQQRQIPTILIGVSFALLDLAEQFPTDLSQIIIMETGGMKGRRKEITRSELHSTLKKAFQTSFIHSEYGMTELLSQAYSKGNGVFYPTKTMDLFIKEITDPFALVKNGKAGLINIIDLANIDSCSFIATEDIGRKQDNGSFEILGRLDASDIRGCNLLIIDS